MRFLRLKEKEAEKREYQWQGQIGPKNQIVVIKDH